MFFFICRSFCGRIIHFGQSQVSTASYGWTKKSICWFQMTVKLFLFWFISNIIKEIKYFFWFWNFAVLFWQLAILYHYLQVVYQITGHVQETHQKTHNFISALLFVLTASITVFPKRNELIFDFCQFIVLFGDARRHLKSDRTQWFFPKQKDLLNDFSWQLMRLWLWN